MIELGTSRFYDLLPPNLHDAHARALSYASDRQFQKLEAHIRKTHIYANVWALDEEACDFLALQHNLKAYETTFSLQTKREMIAIAFITGLKKGTTSAVKQVIATIHGGAELQEWFDYGGDPHTFKITIDAAKQGGIDDEAYEKMLDNIFEYKALRSSLEGITVNLRIHSQMFIGGAVVTGEKTVIKPRLVYKKTAHQMGVGGACVSGELAVIRPHIVYPRLAAGQHAGGACVSGEHAVLYPKIPDMHTSGRLRAGGAVVAGEATAVLPRISGRLRFSGAPRIGGALVSGEHTVIKMTRTEA